MAKLGDVVVEFTTDGFVRVGIIEDESKNEDGTVYYWAATIHAATHLNKERPELDFIGLTMRSAIEAAGAVIVENPLNAEPKPVQGTAEYRYAVGDKIITEKQVAEPVAGPDEPPF